jgi:hypothetical protein
VDLSSQVLEGPEEAPAAARVVEPAAARVAESAAVALPAVSRKADTPEPYQPDEESAPASMRVGEE